VHIRYDMPSSFECENPRQSKVPDHQKPQCHMPHNGTAAGQNNLNTCPRSQVSYHSWNSTNLFPSIATRPKWYGQYSTLTAASFHSGCKDKGILYFCCGGCPNYYCLYYAGVLGTSAHIVLTPSGISPERRSANLHIRQQSNCTPFTQSNRSYIDPSLC